MWRKVEKNSLICAQLTINMKKLLLFLYSLLPCLIPPAFGQSNVNDSLESKLIIEKADSTKLKLIKNLFDSNFGNDMGKAMSYAKQGVAFSDKVKDKKWQPRFYEMEGRMHANMLQLDSAILFFDKALKGYVLVNDKRGQATTLQKFAWVYKRKGEIDKALQSDLQSLRMMEELKDLKGISDGYTRISDDLTRQGKLKEAMEYAQKAIAICEKEIFLSDLSFAYFNAGNVAISLTDDKLALVYYDKALALARSQNERATTMCDFANSRGNALKHLKRYKEALVDYQYALNLAKEIDYPNAVSATIANIGEVNLRMGKYKEALTYQLETVKLQEQNNDLSNLTENYMHLSSIYQNLGDYKSALSYYKKAYLMRDSVLSIESDSAMSKLMTQYETKKKEQTIEQQQTQLDQQKKVQRLGMGVLALLAAFIIFGSLSYRNRMQSNKLLAEKNAEKELLLKEIHHRVKNNLEVISSLLELQAETIADATAKAAVLEGQSRVQSIALIHHQLYRTDDVVNVDFRNFVGDLYKQVEGVFKKPEINVQFEVTSNTTNIGIDTAVPLGLILNELLTNTFKYAVSKNNNNKINIQLVPQPSLGNFVMRFSDNGPGLPAGYNLEKSTSLGMRVVQLLSRQLGGKLNFYNSNGIVFEIPFKV